MLYLHKPTNEAMKRVIIGLYFLILLSTHAMRAEEQYIYTRITNKEGLASTVNSIYKEPDGDVWLGTPDGLFIFNGYDLYRSNDPLLEDRTVLRIEEDKEGSIWVLTDNWLMRRAKEEEGFTPFTAETHRKETGFYSMCHDDGGIWFGSYGSIYRYDFKDRTFSRFCQPEGLEHFTCIYLNKIDDSTLLCGSNMGLFFVDTATGEFTQASLGPIKEISCTMTDSMGRLWIAFYNHGIHVFSKDGTLLKTYSTENSGLSNNIVICFTEKDSKIWAGTDGGGINIIDPKNDDIKVLANVPGDPSSFPAHSIKTLCTDNYGNIWTGTTRDGLILISRSEMKTYSETQLGLSSGLSNKTVLSLFQEEGDDTIWIGTDCEGVNRFDPKNNRFTHYENTFKTKVVSMATYSETELALSIYADGIWLFNKNTGAVRQMKLDEEDLKYAIRHTGRRVIIANGKDNDIYFLRQVVQKYDKDTGRCIPIPLEEGKKSRGHMYAIGKSQKGLYLHDTNGIYRIDEENEILIQLAVADDDVINSGYLGKDGDIWLATGKGLCRFNENTGELTYISTNLFSEATAVVCDNQSRVWVGAGSNLYAYLSDEDSFAMFGESDGASLNEYLAKPRLLSHEGDVYIGGVQGLLTIDSDYTIDASEEPQIKLYSISADRQRLSTDMTGRYEVPRNSKFLSISVSTQETDIFRHKMYRFSFSGGKDYVQLSPTLELQELPKPGRYEVKVSCTKRNGDWSDPYTIMKLRIPQPWYRTGWFILLCILVSGSIVGSVVTVIMNRRRSRMQLALKEQEQHVYEEKVKMLINISHELRTPLTLIMAPLKRLIKETDDKDKSSATLKRIYRQSVRMKDLLNMVLDLRKMEVGKNRLKLEDHDFNRWISETTHDIMTESQIEGIDMVLEMSDTIGKVRFDRQKCEAVMMNILSNAIKHSRSGDMITIRSEMTETGMVRVSVSDEGPGLGDIDPSKMFTRFYQSNNEQYGSGIGLSYSKILVELHGGSIGMYNNSDKGATFWWEIPVSPDLEEAEIVPAKAYLYEILGEENTSDITAVENDSFSTAAMTLMIVDDNQDLLDFLKEALQPEFAGIILATSGNKAMKALNSGKLPDIIISDVNMTDGDGFRLCAEIKKNERLRHIPVILLTARGEQQSQSDSYKVGADAFLAKPFEMETIIELMRGILRRKEDTRRMYLDTDETVTSSYGSHEEGFIIQLNRLISEHIDDPDLDQQLLCRELGVSRASLFNKMKAITGAGAKEYITKIRIEKAKTLLEATNLTLIEVSEKTGFSSQSYFSTAFKNATGMTPSQYKKNRTEA